MLNINPAKILSSKLKGMATDQKSFKQIIMDSRGQGKHNIIARQFIDAKSILEMTERGDKFDYYCYMSAVLAIVGAGIGFILSNLFIIPALALIGMLLPLLIIRFSATGYKKALTTEVETAMSIITSSYVRTNNIISAVTENIATINEPVKSIFEYFLAQTKFTQTNVGKNLRSIRNKVNNEVWREWIDTLILCQKDHTLKNGLQPIVSKLTDVSNIQSNLDVELYKPVKDSIILIIVAIGCIPLTNVLNRVWFVNLFTTNVGKLALAFMAVSILMVLFRMAHATRPIEYRKAADK